MTLSATIKFPPLPGLRSWLFVSPGGGGSFVRPDMCGSVAGDHEPTQETD